MPQVSHLPYLLIVPVYEGPSTFVQNTYEHFPHFFLPLKMFQVFHDWEHVW